MTDGNFNFPSPNMNFVLRERKGIILIIHPSLYGSGRFRLDICSGSPEKDNLKIVGQYSVYEIEDIDSEINDSIRRQNPSGALWIWEKE